MRTRKVPQHVKDKISAALKGRYVSDATRKKMSDAQKKAWARVPRKEDWGEPASINTPIGDNNRVTEPKNA